MAGRMFTLFVALAAMLGLATAQGYDACISKPCQNAGQCIAKGADTRMFNCKCEVGYFGDLCQYGPVAQCGYHAVSILNNFSDYFPDSRNDPLLYEPIKDYCRDSMLVPVKNVRDGCFLDFLGHVSVALGQDKGFAFVGFNGPVYVTLHDRYPIEYSVSSNLEGMIIAQRSLGFSIIQVCREPPKMDYLIVLPAIPSMKYPDLACQMAGFKERYELYDSTARSNLLAILQFMSTTYYHSQPLYYMTADEWTRTDTMFKFTAKNRNTEASSRKLTDLSKYNEKYGVTICRYTGVCARNPCGPNAVKCIPIWGVKCVCKHGFTGARCETDMSPVRAQCGDYTFFVLAHTKADTDKVSFGQATDACSKHVASLPPRAESTCQRSFMQLVSKTLFHSGRYLFYSQRDEQLASATATKFARYAYYQVEKGYHALICHGSSPVMIVDKLKNSAAEELDAVLDRDDAKEI